MVNASEALSGEASRFSPLLEPRSCSNKATPNALLARTAAATSAGATLLASMRTTPSGAARRSRGDALPAAELALALALTAGVDFSSEDRVLGVRFASV